MSMPFYVAPEQVMKDRADFAKKNVARGRPLVAVSCAPGILICAENPSSTLHKVAEIYDRIAFGGVGKYNEFDNLRKFGVRQADLTGYQYSREDVTANSLANTYAQILGNVFTHEMKPLEVEILVAEVADEPAGDQLFHIVYDGIVLDDKQFSVLGGDSDVIVGRLEESYQPGLDLAAALGVAVGALAGDERTIAATDLEAALLDRAAVGRAFRRLTDDELVGLLPPPLPAEDDAGAGDGAAEDEGEGPADDGPAEPEPGS